MAATTTQQEQGQSRLIYFPVSFFAVVMGLSGLTLAWKAAGQNMTPHIYQTLGLLTTLTMIAVTLIYGLKLWRHKEAVIAESRHPIRLNFFPAFSISLLLLSAIWQQAGALSQFLWGLGAIIQLTLTLYVMSSWIHHTHYTLAHANPSWFIPVVGNIIVPVTGASLGYHEISWFFFSIGIVFWLVLLTIVMYRLFFHEPLPARMTPMLFILLAPPSIGFVSYTDLTGGVDVFARILYYFALFLALLLFSNITRFMKVPFFISSWAYSFPLAALTIATSKMNALLPSALVNLLSFVLLALLTLLLAWLVLRTFKAIMHNEICVPD